MDDVPPSSGSGVRAPTLRRAVHDAYDAVQKAHVAYEQALAMASDADASPDGWFALRRQGREYAEAVSQYSRAVTAWLDFMETARMDTLRLIWKTARRPTEATAPPPHISRPNEQFVLHSSLLAMKSGSRQKLILLAKGTRGRILERVGTASGPGLVLIEVEQQQYLVWQRDLHECAELLH